MGVQMAKVEILTFQIRAEYDPETGFESQPRGRIRQGGDSRHLQAR